MGGQLVKAAIRCGHGLPLGAYKCLMHMAVSIMPDNIGAPTYYGGRDALVRAVYGQLAPKDSKRRENQYRQISENLKKLRETGLIDPLNEGHKGHRVNYRLTLNEPAKGGSTAHPIKGESTAHPLDDQKDAKGELTAPTKGELRADSKGGSTAHPKEASTGSNKQEASADSGPQTETAVETEPETAVGSLITSSNHLQKSTTVGTRQVMDEIGIGNGKTQDQKRCKHHPCGVYESQHHRLAEFGIEPHDFTWWPDNDSKPDERKRRRRNYAAQNRYQTNSQRRLKGKPDDCPTRHRRPHPRLITIAAAGMRPHCSDPGTSELWCPSATPNGPRQSSGAAAAPSSRRAAKQLNSATNGGASGEGSTAASDQAGRRPHDQERSKDDHDF